MARSLEKRPIRPPKKSKGPPPTQKQTRGRLKVNTQHQNAIKPGQHVLTATNSNRCDVLCQALLAEEKKLEGCDACRMGARSDSPGGAPKLLFLFCTTLGSRERAKVSAGNDIDSDQYQDIATKIFFVLQYILKSKIFQHWKFSTEKIICQH